MNLSRKKIACFVFLTVLIASLGGGVAYLFTRLYHLDDYKDQILASLQETLKRRVVYEKGEFSLRFGPSFVFTKVVVKEKDGTADFITADRLALKVEILPLLGKRLALKEIVLDHPHIQITRAASGLFNFSDLLEEKQGEMPLQITGINVKKGNVRFLDQFAAPAGLATSLVDADLTVGRFSRGKTADIKLSAFVVDEGKQGVLSLAGTAAIPPRDKPLADSRLNLTVSAKNLNTGHYWPYYSRYVPFRQATGFLDIDGSINGMLTQFVSRGKIRFSNLRFEYPQVFHAILTPRDFHFSYDMERTPQSVNVKSLDLTVDGLNVKGGCAIIDLLSKDPRITAHAVTNNFDLERFAKYIPYGIIVKDPADYIEQHIRGGIYKLDEGILDGRVSQILHMEKGTNYNVLFIKGRVEKGLVSYGPDVPSFNSIQGTLEMRGKDFNLIGMTGKFGGSPFTLSGKIADYPLDTPSSYPFTMNMTPKQSEISWLMGSERGRKLNFAGDSVLHLVGSGFSSEYALSAEWNLTPASYGYPDVISKPAGRSNLLSGKARITKEEAHVTDFSCTISPFSLTGGGVYRFAGPGRLSADVKTNQFPINEIAPLLPFARKYQPSGKFQASAHGEGSAVRIPDIPWRGEIAFTGFSFTPSAPVRTVRNMTGIVRFNGSNMETSQLTATIGNSLVSGTGNFSGFDNPTVNLVFSSPSLDMSDFGWHSPQREIRTGRVQGDITLRDNNLQIRSLNAQFFNSAISIKGTIQNLHNPKIDISVTSPRIDVEDVILLASLERSLKRDEPPAAISLKARVSAESGKVRDILFSKLTTVVTFADKKLSLQPLECQLFGGRFAGKWQIDFGAGEVPRYQVGYVLEKVDAGLFSQAIGFKSREDITGTLSASGDITAKGNDSLQLKQTSVGSAKIRCEEGSLRKFATLSKIFSLLNVSQLLKFQLPNMVSGGMPYNQITATLAIRDGIISSNDFFINSDAMNISVIGSINIVKEEMNTTIGIKPLQTVDKVVSHIPIVGWILTGKEKSVVTAYFEAKGKIDNPSVSPIPVKSLGKGVFDIFKRVFQLPAKLITDTGEVVLGN